MIGCVVGWMTERILNEWIVGWMENLITGWTNGWMSALTNSCMDE